MPNIHTVNAARARVAARRRWADAGRDVDVPGAERDLRAAVLAERIRETVAEAPPLTADQVAQLRGLLTTEEAAA